MTFKICLLGSVPKGDETRKNWFDWKNKYRDSLARLKNVEFIDGDSWRDESNALIVFGHDSNLIKTSDIVIVNAESKIGVGTAQEMLIAKYFSKPVVTVLPKGTHHRRSNMVFGGSAIEDWIHPFILTVSDLLVENIEDCAEWINAYMKNPEVHKIKDISIIDHAIAAYESRQTS